MPEGDVVWRTAARLHAALAGRQLIASDLRWPSLATVDLSGRTVLEAVSRGKHILIRLDRLDRLHPLDGLGPGSDQPADAPGPRTSGSGVPLTLHSHLRMEGQWRVDATLPAKGTNRRTPADARAVLVTEEWTATGLRLGMLDLVATADEPAVVGHLGPDLLGPDWSAERALANLASAPDRPVGEALLDQRNLAGIGTFYLAETMFLLGVTPWTPVEDLGPAGLARAVDRAHRLLRLNRDRVRQVTTGDARPGREAFVHGRSGRPCRRCGSTVRVASIGRAPTQRVAFYCPSCQRGPAPTDDEHPQRPLGARRPG